MISPSSNRSSHRRSGVGCVGANQHSWARMSKTSLIVQDSPQIASRGAKPQVGLTSGKPKISWLTLTPHLLHCSLSQLRFVREHQTPPPRSLIRLQSSKQRGRVAPTGTSTLGTFLSLL